MLRITEKEDFEARYREVEAAVEKWREARSRVSRAVQEEFQSKLLISLIYHDAALEGDVLTHSEIKAAIDTSIVSDSSLIPSYEDITNFSAACQVARELARQKKRVPIKVELIRELYAILAPEARASELAYRRENPLHRLYYHEIAAPEEVPAQMKKLEEWLASERFAQLHPIDRAGQLHWRLMGVFPWLTHTGRLSRILALLVLEQDDYPLAVIHSIDRQQYYEALRAGDTKPMLKLYLESIQTCAKSATRVYEEALAYKRRAS